MQGSRTVRLYYDAALAPFSRAPVSFLLEQALIAWRIGVDVPGLGKRGAARTLLMTADRDPTALLEV
jgi:hypothetical protein